MPRYITPSTWRSLLRLIELSEANIRSVLSEVLASKTLTRRQRMNKSAQVAEILRALDAQVPSEARRVVQISYDKAQRASMKPAPMKVLEARDGFSKLHREAVNSLADNLTHSLGDATTTLGRRVDDSIRRHSLATALEQAHTGGPGFASDNLVKRLQTDGMTAFVARNGARWSLKNYADMAIATTTSEAQNMGVINTARSRGLDLIQIDNHEHHADVCSPYDGKIFSLTGATPGYPVIDKFPPFHPRCEHYAFIPPIAFEMRERYPVAA